MITKIALKYKDLVESYEIQKFQRIESSHRLVVLFKLKDGNKLYAKDYFFADKQRRYAYHFEDFKGKMIFRFDNCKRWENIDNFPFHKHLPEKNVGSDVMNLEKVFEEIRQFYAK